MRQEIFKRGVISRENFNREIKEKAIISQKREGIADPLAEEHSHDWQERIDYIKDTLTDFYFAYNLPHALFKKIVEETITGKSEEDEIIMSFNPEMAPWELLFAQGEKYEKKPVEERERFKHHLEEIKVVLIKTMICDQLRYIGLAKKYLTIKDLKNVRKRRIGRGKLGGKSAGLLLAWKILQRASENGVEGLPENIELPDSYFIGSDVHYDFTSLNNLEKFINQKYKDHKDILEEYPEIVASYVNAIFPHDIVDQLRLLVEKVGKTPLIVRSSSLLEDNFGMSFAGKYNSYFCPNQGTVDENLNFLVTAIKKIYASVLNPDALMYRKKMDLIDYDERMALLIQPVKGHKHNNYYFPDLAGVGFSQNPFRWSPRIKKEDGFLRLVCGIGTRAVDRNDNDYPRMIALSHPQLRPEKNAKEIKKYSQQYIDFVELDKNKFGTAPITEVIDSNFHGFRKIASIEKEDRLEPIFGLYSDNNCVNFVITFDNLMKDPKFINLLKKILKTIEIGYKRPVDIEFTIDFQEDLKEPYKFSLLQCRPLSSQSDQEAMVIPDDIGQDRILFISKGMAPLGKVSDIKYVIYISPENYQQIKEPKTRLEIAYLVGRLNKRLENEYFILMGPGRWGSCNLELGVKVTYADIYNTKVLIEMAKKGDKGMPELSYGTHFFQDLVEAKIYPLPLFLNTPGCEFNDRFFENAKNYLSELLPNDKEYEDILKVLDIEKETNGQKLTIIMNGDEETSIAYFN